MNKILFIGSRPPPFHGQSIAFDSAIKALDKENIKVLETSFRGGIVSALIGVTRYFIMLPFYLIFFRPQIIYFLCSRTLVGSSRDYYLLALTYFSKIKLVNHLHGSDFKLFIAGLPKIIGNVFVKLYKRVDKHIVLVEGMKQQFEGICNANKVVVVPNFYSDSNGTNKLSVRDFDESELKVVYLSSIMKTKGIFELVDACKKLNNSGVKVRAFIAGGFLGDEEMSAEESEIKLKSEIEQTDYIELVGYVNKEQKYELLSKCHVFALPSYYRSEAVPLSIIEAMSMGCAILATNYRYLPDVVKEGVNGTLVETRDVDSIVQALTSISKERSNLKSISGHNSLEASQFYSEKSYRLNIRKELLMEEYS